MQTPQVTQMDLMYL